jgi:hypothetical protein
MNRKYLLSLITVLAVTGTSFGTVGFAQTIPPLQCSIGASPVGTNQPVILTASGGNGTYYWSGQNLNITNSAGNQFAVSYPNPGNYSVMVSSAGQTASCTVVVVAGASSGSLSCSPAVQNVILGQTVAVSAFGGSGSYVWSSPDLSIINPNGSGFSANYASLGLKTLTVTSAGLVASCAVNVLAGSVVPPPIVTPGLPNTGGGYGQ